MIVISMVVNYKNLMKLIIINNKGEYRMKKIIIIMIVVVSSYMYVSSEVVDNGVNSINNHNVQLEESLNY